MTPSSSTTTSTSGGSGSGPGQPRITVQRALEAVLVSADPGKACSRQYVTQHYLDAAYGGRGGCVGAQNPGSGAGSIRGLGVELNGDQATATVHPSGGLYDGEKLTVSLVKVSDGWRVDSLKSNAPVGP